MQMGWRKLHLYESQVRKEERAHYIQKVVWKKWVFSLDLKERSDLADLTSWGSLLIPNRLGRAGEGVHYFYTADYIRSA